MFELERDSNVISLLGPVYMLPPNREIPPIRDTEISRLAGIPWLPIEAHTILGLHIHRSFIPQDIFTPTRHGGISRLAGTISFMYT